jgi:hypothetical protein
MSFDSTIFETFLERESAGLILWIAHSKVVMRMKADHSFIPVNKKDD